MLALTSWSITFRGKGKWVVLLAPNLFINGYPFMLKRNNRLRVQAALDMLALLPGRPISSSLSRELQCAETS
jgi:hypothetical protein